MEKVGNLQNSAESFEMRCRLTAIRDFGHGTNVPQIRAVD